MDPGTEQRQLPAGTMLDEKYRIDHLLAVGGMGAVYVGTHTKLRKRVAIKVLNPELSTPQMVERFHREAITASQVGHEGIAQVTDLGTSRDGEPFLVMELLEGESLGTRLRSTGPLPIHDACELTCSILAPLGAAHRAGIVHRDLKPDNVFLVKQSRGEMVKLLDFGISRATGLDTEFRLTTTGLVLGTPFYMSPEQAQGASSITPASDLYSLGVMLYEMLIGKVPIQGENYNQLMYHVITGSFTPPRQLRSDIPPALEHVVLRAMALSPTARPASAAELEHSLLVFCRPTFRAHATEGGASERFSLQTPAPRVTGAPPLVGPPSGYGTSPGPGTGRGGGIGIGTEQTMMATPAGHMTGQPSGYGYGPAATGATVGAAPRRRPIGLIIGGAVAAVAVAVVAVVVATSSPSSKPPVTPGAVDGSAATAAAATAAPVAPPAAPDGTSAPAPAGAVAPPAGTPPATSAAATVRLRFDVEPAEATLLVDGKPVTGRELEVARDDADHILQTSAPGYLSEEEKIRFDESQRLMVRLKPEPKDVRDGSRRPRPDRTERPERTGIERDPDKPKRPERIDSDSPYK